MQSWKPGDDKSKHICLETEEVVVVNQTQNTCFT
jgi:hypothetical protein